MKSKSTKKSITILSFFLIILASSQLIFGDNLLNYPESIVFDQLNNRYLVSNYYQGKIVEIDSLGEHYYFKENLGNCAGLHIIDNLVYAATSQGLKGIDLETAEIEFSLAINGMGLLNDITSDSDGFLYVTDSDSNKVYKIDPADSTYETIVESGIIEYPNGIIFEEETNSLIICSQIGSISPIYRVSLPDNTATLMFNGNYGGSDGIARDRYGNYYIASGYSDNIYKYDHNFENNPEIFSTGHDNPADIYCNNFDDILAVPNLVTPRVDFVPLDLTSIDNINFTPSDQTLGDCRTFAIAIEDIDNDDDQDIFLTNYVGASKLWINDGEGNFTANEMDFSTNSDGSHGVDIEDLNGDNYPDIFLVNNNSSSKIFLMMEKVILLIVDKPLEMALMLMEW